MVLASGLQLKGCEIGLQDLQKTIYIMMSQKTSDGSGSKIIDPGRVNFLWLGSGWVSHFWFGVEFVKFPLKMSNFSIFFPSGQKKSLRVRSKSTQVKCELASYLLQVKSKLG